VVALVDAQAQGPDFFIVGAPKCGTSALTDYLAQHPEVGMCAAKETHFFAGEDYWGPFGAFRGDRPPTRAAYLGLFAGTERARRRGEASVWYLYSATAPRSIVAFAPDADIVVMVRSPWEMLPSLHSQLVFIGIEPERDFARALALDAERERGGGPPGFPSASYRAAAAFGEQLGRYLDAFGSARVHVVVYERFREDPAGVYASVCGALGVDPGFVPDLRVVNPNTEARSHAVNRLLIRPPRALRRIGALAPRAAAQRLAGRVGDWNTRLVARRDPGPEVAAALRPLVAEQADQLERLTGLDLGGWVERVDAVLA
jgi:hypothetical protein